MKYEETLKIVQDFVFSGKDPFDISKDITNYIINNATKATGITTKIKEEVAGWIDEWVDIFPEGLRSGGKLVRSDRKICLDKMAKFIRDYPAYSKEVIVSATKKYVANKKKDNYNYITCAVNLINHRDKGSELAALCREFQLKKELNQEHVELEHDFQRTYFL